MRRFTLWMIDLYQSQISPRKGFHCAHHRLHGQETCSNAVKVLITTHGVLKSLPAIRARFKECRGAFEQLSLSVNSSTRADLPIPCDVPCDVTFGNCGGDVPSKSGGTCISPCIFVTGKRFSRRTQQQFLVSFCLCFLLLSYWLYGREVNLIYVEKLDSNKSSLWSKILERDDPKIRVMLQAGGRKYYTKPIFLNQQEAPYKLVMKDGPETFVLEKIEIQDARLSVGGDLFVVGQILDSIDNPKSTGKGDRFEFNIKRRWHFF